ncbi:hypothetical protein M9H77_20468 [Catharanthus roseus]|uniref:Uncharacterized protein n=1 Tax=Catharanthus roseus TaxID=4058 RepID=A0ACC0ALK2_CATRO|nr:hypothetical protein M9H77_20468 [Catharanthus roseus]
MAHYTHITFFLSSLLILSAIQGIHGVDYTVTNRAGNTPGGARFNREIGASYSQQTLTSATNFIWRTFQQNTPADRKNVPRVSLFIDDMNGVAYASNNEIHVSARYIQSYSGDVRREITGVLYHEMVHIWQWNGNGQAPGGLIEGIADYVRLKAGYAPGHWVKPGQGNRWDQGYDVTARFLDYCNGLRNGFVAELNKKMRNGYNNGYFVELLGKNVDQLWSEYKASQRHCFVYIRTKTCPHSKTKKQAETQAKQAIMARSISFFISFLVVILAAIQRCHAVNYAVTNRAANTPGGARFNRDIGVQYSMQTLKSATNFIWRTFQQNTAADRKNVPKVTLFVDDMDGVAYAINGEIHVSARYIQGYSGDVKREITGVLYHEMAHIWQWNGNGQAPGGLIEGIADYVRLKAGYVPSHWVKPGQGNRWDQGYDVTARFLDYCNGLRNGFVAQLNKKMRNGYSNNYFVQLLGKNVDQLWRDYKAKYNN